MTQAIRTRSPLLIVTRCLALLLIAACSEAPIQRGVVHLDPRLPDGRSSAAVLAALETPAPTPPLASWTQTGRTWSTPADFTVATATVGGLSFTTDVPRATRALVTWRRTSDPAGTWPAAAAAEVAVEPGQPVALQLAGHPAWNGTVDVLRITPDRELGLDARLTGVSLLQRGFWDGFEPLGQGEGVPRSDGGLVTLNDAGRRVWPASFGVPLVATVDVPRAGRLLFDVALSAAHREALERVHLAVDIAAAGTDPTQAKGWTRAWSRELVPRQAPTETLWQWVRVDLAEHAGERIEVRFRAWAGHGVDAVSVGIDGRLDDPSLRADVLWGAPEIVGDPDAWPLPNLLLVTLDTTRADFGGAPTPYLDELRARGITFSDTLATSNSTQPSHASILTGTYPMDHGVHDNYSQLLGANRTLPERLRELGYHTVGAVSQRFIGAGYGYGQGFDEFYQAGPGASLDGSVTVELLQKRIAEWGRIEPERPVFLWLHLFDPHTPYTAPDDYARSHRERFGPAPAAEGGQAFPAATPSGESYAQALPWLAGATTVEQARDLYAVEVAYADALVENLASSLASAELLGKTAFFVTADHGESLGEQGIWFDHRGVHAAVSEVPFIVVIPGGPAGTVDHAPVSGIDLAPTLLRFAAAGRPVSLDGMRGRDLLAGQVTGPLEQGAPLAERPRLVEHAERSGYALRLGAEQLIRMERDVERTRLSTVAGQPVNAPGLELIGETYYDFNRTPSAPPFTGEWPLRRTDLAGARLLDFGAAFKQAPEDDPQVAVKMQALRAQLDALLADAWDIPAGASAKRETTPAERADLDALGY